MNRYEIIHVDSSERYIETCPLILLSNALTSDIERDKILLQLKFQNMDSRTIKAVFVKVECFSIDGVYLNEDEEFQYLDLKIDQYKEFGSSIPLYLKLKNTREVKIQCEKILFCDGTEWENTINEYYTKLPEKIVLSDLLGNDSYNELLYSLREEKIFTNTVYKPFSIMDYYFCPCGRYRNKNEHYCFNCGKDKQWWNEKISSENIKTLMERKVERDRISINQKKKNKIMKIVGIISIIMISIFAIGLRINSENKLSNIILGEWTLYVDELSEGSNNYLRITFNKDGTGTAENYKDREYAYSFDFEYRLDEKEKIIYKVYEDKSEAVWMTITDYDQDSIDFIWKTSIESEGFAIKYK